MPGSLGRPISPLSTDKRNLAPRDRNARLKLSRAGIAELIEDRPKYFVELPDRFRL